MDENYNHSSKLKLIITQFFMPHSAEVVTYLAVSLLALLITSNKAILVILSGDSPVTDLAIMDVFGTHWQQLLGLLDIPILGRIILFIFWLAIGSVVYMFVWLFQNIVVEVYDDISYAKLKDRKQIVEEDESWWGTTLAHAIFIGSSIILLLFYIILFTSLLLPASTILFQMGLQHINQLGGIFRLFISVLGTMIAFYVFVLFWKLVFRLKGYLFNAI